MGFPDQFPSSFGGDSYFVAPIATTIDYIADWSARLQTRLYEQFREKPKLLAIITGAIAPQVQDLEEAAQQITSLLSIADSSGAQLDRIGRIVGQLRLGNLDENYRHYLRARIRANLSRGTPEDMLTVLRLLVNDSTVDLDYVLEPPAGYTLEAEGVMSAMLAAVASSMLGDANRAGVRLIFRWRQYDVAHSFTCAPTPVAGNDGPISTLLGFADETETDGGHMAGASAP